MSTNVGLAAGRYSGTRRPDLYRTPQALHNVFGPIGPVRHCGVLSVAQWRHLRPSPLPADEVSSGVSFFLAVFFAVFGCGVSVTTTSVSEEEFVGESTDNREFHMQGAARDRLLRAALAGTVISGRKPDDEWFRFNPVWNSEVFEASSSWSVREFIPDIKLSFSKSWVEKESSTKLESHSSSAKSSY